MGWYSDIKTVLAGEPRDWLAYLHGQRLEIVRLMPVHYAADW